MTTETATATAAELDELARTVKIRELNDLLRTSTDPLGLLLIRGQWVVTRGIADKGNAFIDHVTKAVREFTDFSNDNDPWGEHDCAMFDIDVNRRRTLTPYRRAILTPAFDGSSAVRA